MCVCVCYFYVLIKKKGSNIPCLGEGTRFNHKVPRNEQKYIKKNNIRIKLSQDKKKHIL